MKQQKKTLYNFDSILQYFDTNVKLKMIYKEAPFPKAKSERRFINITRKYILGAIKNYKYSANVIFKKGKDKEFIYNVIKQKKYCFSKMLKSNAYQVLKEYLEKHKEHKEYDSWVSKNRITIVIDKMECERTTNNFEKSKRLHKAENGHYLINLVFVVGDDKEIYPLNSVLYDPECDKTSIEVASEMVKECIEFIKDSGIELNRIGFSGDREFLAHIIFDYFSEYDQSRIKCVTGAKSNTVFYSNDGFKYNGDYLKNYLFHHYLSVFKYSTRLDGWCIKHNKPRYKYWTAIRRSNFGIVRIVVFIEADKELTENNYKNNMHILINFGANMNAIQMIETYRGHRWQIEVFHKDWKQVIEIVKSYTGLSFVGLSNHYILRTLSYLYLAKYIANKKSWKGTIGQNKRKFVMLM